MIEKYAIVRVRDEKVIDTFRNYATAIKFLNKYQNNFLSRWNDEEYELVYL